MNRSQPAYILAVTACAGLILLGLAWELQLAPLRDGGSWLALKVLPLVPVLTGLLRQRLYTVRWSTMLILAYFIEGCVRGYSDGEPGNQLALIEIALSLVYFGAAIALVRLSASRTTGGTPN